MNLLHMTTLKHYRDAFALPTASTLSSILFCLLGNTLAWATCNAPPALGARVQAKPSIESYSAVATWFGDHKQFGCAARYFGMAAKLDPRSSSLSYMWGLSLYLAEQDAVALPPLHRAAQLDPSDIRPHLILGGALDRMKRTSEAEAEWRAALAIDPTSAAALEALSHDLLDEKDYPGVVALLDKPTGRAARSPIENLNLGAALASTARLDQAARVLREGLNTTPDSLPIANELAAVLMLLSRTEEAFAVFDLALQKHPGDQATQLHYLRSLVSSNSGKAPPLAHELLAVYPKNWEVQYLNGILEAREGHLESARNFFEQSVAQNPKDAQSQRELGNTLAKLGNLNGAKEHLENAIALGDDQPEVHYNLARVLRNLGDTDQARERLQVYQKVKNAQSNRSQAAGKAQEGDQAMAGGDTARAASLYRDALQSDPDEPILSYKLAKALDKLNDSDGEKAALERALQLNPRFAEAQNQMGYLAVRGGDPGHAESCFRAAVQASPSYVGAWINLAATLASEAKWKEAKQAVERALEIDPDNAEARGLDQAITAAQTSP